MSSILDKYRKCDISPRIATQFFLVNLFFTMAIFAVPFFFSNVFYLQLSTVFAFTIIIQIIILSIYFKYRSPRKLQQAEKIRWEPGESPKFRLEEVILKEFDYARETAAQAMRDRHTLVNFFLIITGVIVTAALTVITKENVIRNISRPFLLEIICLIFCSIGWFYFIKIIRLRQAWHESATAMNQIKKFYFKYSDVPSEIAMQAFRWQQHTLPAPEKKSTVFYYSALLISFVSSISLTIAWFSAINATDMQFLWWFPCLAGGYHFLFQRQMYTVFLKKSEVK